MTDSVIQSHIASAKLLRSQAITRWLRDAWVAVFGIRQKVNTAPLTFCQAARSDGECYHRDCPQIRDGEPGKSGRTCPLPWWSYGDE